MVDLSIVGITRSNYANIHNKIELAIERGGGLDLTNGDDVVVKINLCDFRMPETGAVTHPIFLGATLNYLRSTFEDLNIRVVESDATVARPDLLIRWLGFEPILKRHGAKYVNLTREARAQETVKKHINGRYFQEVTVPRVIADSDFLITMAKLKTALLTNITCCLKNQFGCLPTPKKSLFHPNLDDVIADVNLAMKPDYCIVDGIIGMGGVKGPNLGVPVNSGIVVTGKDPVSVDAVCARLMGFNPFSIGHIKKAHASGIGRLSYKVVGERAPSFKKDFEFNPLYATILRIVNSLNRS